MYDQKVKKKHNDGRLFMETDRKYEQKEEEEEEKQKLCQMEIYSRVKNRDFPNKKNLKIHLHLNVSRLPIHLLENGKNLHLFLFFFNIEY